MKMSSVAPLAEAKPSPRIIAKYQLERLQAKFGLEVSLIWSNGRAFGIYRPATNQIWLGSKLRVPVEDALLHSYAHALCKQDHINNQHDSIHFLECLWQVVLFLYSNPEKYSWWADYSAVFNFGKNRIRNWRIEHENLD